MSGEKILCPNGCGAEIYPRDLHTHTSEKCTTVRAGRAEDDPDQVDLSTFGGGD